jgi:hypothetical protein
MNLIKCEWGSGALTPPPVAPSDRTTEMRQKSTPSIPRVCEYCADKLALALTPSWLYLRLARLSGEIDEYLETAKAAGFLDATVESWYPQIVAHFARIAAEEQPSVFVGTSREI